MSYDNVAVMHNTRKQVDNLVQRKKWAVKSQFGNEAEGCVIVVVTSLCLAVAVTLLCLRLRNDSPTNETAHRALAHGEEAHRG